MRVNWQHSATTLSGSQGLSGLLNASETTLEELDLSGFPHLDKKLVKLPSGLIKLKLGKGLHNLNIGWLQNLTTLDIEVATFGDGICFLWELKAQTPQLTSLVLRTFRLTYPFDQLVQLFTLCIVRQVKDLRLEVHPSVVTREFIEAINEAARHNLTIARIESGETWREQLEREERVVLEERFIAAQQANEIRDAEETARRSQREATWKAEQARVDSTCLGSISKFCRDKLCCGGVVEA